MTINCQVCGTANPDGTTYCEGCGVELTASAVPAEAVTTEAVTTEAAPAVPAAPEAAPVAQAEAPAAREPLTPPDSLGTAGTASPIIIASADAAPMAAVAESAPAAESPEAVPATSTPEAAPVAAAIPPAAPAAAAPSTGAASLGIKKFGAPSGESIPLQGERLVVGRFDASSGPVDIDLSGLGGQEHISRRHAELYREGGVWHVRDLGSTNGVYVKRKGESAFSPRLQEPAALSDGDEVAFGNLMFTFQQS